MNELTGVSAEATRRPGVCAAHEMNASAGSVLPSPWGGGSYLQQSFCGKLILHPGPFPSKITIIIE